MRPVHQSVTTKIHYYGTPVALLSTLNPDGTPNLAPMSSIWWLGQVAVLGLSTQGRTFENLARTGEVVINLASAELAPAVDRLALTTGSDPVPAYKAAIGTVTVRDKFAHAGLTPAPSERVSPPRVAEARIVLEGRVASQLVVGEGKVHAAVEVRIERTLWDETLVSSEHRHHLDPNRWHPLLMSFLEFYTTQGPLGDSRLAKAF
ncbi:MAG: flavin reductase family protein [Gemmatimonadaceae bacterium]|nr:flavin reductase family protein [Gemmatimonadaceae bacterium]